MVGSSSQDKPIHYFKRKSNGKCLKLHVEIVIVIGIF